MSLDKSLKSKDTLARHRNVLTRAERVLLLQDDGTLGENASPWGLPKVGHRKASVGKKEKVVKKEEEGESTAEDGGAAAGASS